MRLKKRGILAEMRKRSKGYKKKWAKRGEGELNEEKEEIQR